MGWQRKVQAARGAQQGSSEERALSGFVPRLWNRICEALSAAPACVTCFPFWNVTHDRWATFRQWLSDVWVLSQPAKTFSCPLRIWGRSTTCCTDFSCLQPMFSTTQLQIILTLKQEIFFYDYYPSSPIYCFRFLSQEYVETSIINFERLRQEQPKPVYFSSGFFWFGWDFLRGGRCCLFVWVFSLNSWIYI